MLLRASTRTPVLRMPLMLARRTCASAAAEGNVRLELREDKVAVVTLHNPAKLNALTADMGDEFEAMVRQLERDADQYGAVVLTGAGGAFSAGGDFGFLRDRHSDTPSRNSVIMRRFYERFLCVRRIPTPVIAAINGPAIGAGLCLALACDVRIAAADAKLGVTFVGLGLHPGMGCTHFLPTIVGHQVANRLLFTGEVVSGTEAERLGMVLQSVPKDRVLPTAIELAARMAKVAPVALRSCVRTMRVKQEDGLDAALWREAEAQADSYASADYDRGLTALLKRTPAKFGQFEQYGEQLPK